MVAVVVVIAGVTAVAVFVVAFGIAAAAAVFSDDVVGVGAG